MLYTCKFIENLNQWDPNKKILTEGKKVKTVEQLYSSSLILAQTLLKYGVKKGDRVVVVLEPGADFLVIMYANMLIRTTISIIDPEMGIDNYKAKFKQFKPTHAFVDSRLIFLNEHPIIKFFVRKMKPLTPFFPTVNECQVFTLGKKLPILKKSKHLVINENDISPKIDLNKGNLEDDLLVTYTSGTLSEPKGVVHSYRSLSNSIYYLSKMLNDDGNHRIATHLPHFMLLGINAGIQVYIWDNAMSAIEKLNFIEKNEITTVFGPPSDFISMIQFLEKKAKLFPNCLTNFYFGSAPIHAAFLNKIDKVSHEIKMTCLYGMTENLMVSRQNGSEKIHYNQSGDLVGKAFPGVHITIAEDKEILLESNQMFSRYWHETSPKKIHHTGDFGQFDSEGNLVLIGRKKNMIIRRNQNIYPGLYEPTINKIPGVEAAIFIGIYNEEKADEDVILVIETEANLTEIEIQNTLIRGKFSIDKEALPDKIIFKKLARSGRQNKINRKLIREEIKTELLK